MLIDPPSKLEIGRILQKDKGKIEENEYVTEII